MRFIGIHAGGRFPSERKSIISWRNGKEFLVSIWHGREENTVWPSGAKVNERTGCTRSFSRPIVPHKLLLTSGRDSNFSCCVRSYFMTRTPPPSRERNSNNRYRVVHILSRWVQFRVEPRPFVIHPSFFYLRYPSISFTIIPPFFFYRKWNILNNFSQKIFLLRFLFQFFENVSCEIYELTILIRLDTNYIFYILITLRANYILNNQITWWFFHKNNLNNIKWTEHTVLRRLIFLR